jgi:hypothetical protein
MVRPLMRVTDKEIVEDVVDSADLNVHVTLKAIKQAERR